MLFDILAKVGLVHVWTFLLWWVAVAILMEMKPWVALLLTMVIFPGRIPSRSAQRSSSSS